MARYDRREQFPIPVTAKQTYFTSTIRPVRVGGVIRAQGASLKPINRQMKDIGNRYLYNYVHHYSVLGGTLNKLRSNATFV